MTEVSGVGHKSGIFPVFRRLVAPCSDRVDSELSSGLPPDYEPRVAARRAGRRGVGALLMRYSEPTAAFHKSMSGQTFRSNGPFCRESLPYLMIGLPDGIGAGRFVTVNQVEGFGIGLRPLMGQGQEGWVQVADHGINDAVGRRRLPESLGEGDSLAMDRRRGQGWLLQGEAFDRLS